MKNIIFDLGGVVFTRDYNVCSKEMLAFWDILHSSATPQFWLDFDRGALTWEETCGMIADTMNYPFSLANKILKEALEQTEVNPIIYKLIKDLKSADYRLFVLSNMSFEFIAELHKHEIFKMFENEVISCDYNLVKPEREIYELALNKFNIEAANTLFIDDKPENTAAARKLGIPAFDFNRHNATKSCKELREMLLDTNNTI